jgi:arsenite methyltransferase
VAASLSRDQRRCCIYGQLGREVAVDEPIRPGGLALTARALSLSLWPPGARVLDLGCGSGAALSYLIGQGGLRAWGLDPSGQLLGRGRESDPELPLIRAASEDLPCTAASLDGILAECSLSLVEDVDRVLRECFRVLKMGALILIHDVYARQPNGAAALRNLPVRCCLAGAVSRQEWLARLTDAGFQVLLWEDHTAALKEFAARVIFSYGSLEAFWCKAGNQNQPTAAREIQETVAQSSPGYFLLLAHKPLLTPRFAP